MGCWTAPSSARGTTEAFHIAVLMPDLSSYPLMF